MQFLAKHIIAALAVLFATSAFAEENLNASTVVASVNGTNITLGHMILVRESLPLQYQSAPDEQLFRGILEQIIRQTLLSQVNDQTETLRTKLTIENDRRILRASEAVDAISSKLIDEDAIKKSLLSNMLTPEIISKNLAELKANKISLKYNNEIVLGADSVIDINRELISKPKDREEAMEILKKLNGKTHYLISSVCISKNGSMIWNYTDKASLTMKDLTNEQLKEYLSKITDKALYAYNVYQIEGEGRSLFSKIEGDENTIMGLPIKKIKEYLNNI